MLWGVHGKNGEGASTLHPLPPSPPLSQLLRAINDGYDVRGVYFWTLMDNIEWHEGFHIKFGLFEWDPALQRSNVRDWVAASPICVQSEQGGGSFVDCRTNDV